MGQALRVLILEDCQADADLVEFELQEAGFDFVAKRTATESDYVRALQEFSPDLILSDYDMPLYDGIGALMEARRQCPDVPFILVTGAMREEKAIEILTRGAKDYVMKNRLERLAPAIRRVLAEATEQKARKKAEEDLLAAHKGLEKEVEERTAELRREVERRRKVEQALRRNNQRLQILSDIGSRLLASSDPQSLVEELCLKVMEFLDCQAFFNFLVDETSQRLHLNACAGISAETAREIEWLDYGVAVCGCVARDGLRIVAENIPDVPDPRTELVKSLGIMAYACHPLMDKNHVIGTLSFGTRTRSSFTADDLDMMKAVADQVAIAMNRMRVEKDLERREREFRATFEESTVGMAQADPMTRRFTLANRKLCEITGYSAEELFGKTFVEITHPDDRDEDVRRIDLAIREGKGHWNSEKRYFRKDGETIWVSVDGVLVRDDNGRPFRTMAIVQDITQRKLNEEAIRQSDKLHRFLGEHMPFGIWVSEPDGRIRYVSDSFLEMIGMTLEQCRASGWIDRLLPEDRDRYQADWKRCLSEGRPWNCQYRIRDRKGANQTILSRGTPICNERNEIDCWAGINLDIAELSRARILAQERTEELESVMNAIPAIVYLARDPDCSAIVGNRMANDFMKACGGENLSRTAPNGHYRSHRVFRNGKELPNEELPMQYAAKNRTEVMDTELEFLFPDGRRVPVRGNAAPLFDQKGAVRGCIAVFMDITRRKQIEEDLARTMEKVMALNKEMESFSYSVSHDLQAPLRAIRGYVRMILREKSRKTDAKTDERLSAINENSARMQMLIVDLLALSKVVRQEMSFRPVDMDSLFESVWKECADTASGKPPVLKKDGLPPALGDRTLLRQVLTNLISNALKYSRQRELSEIEVGGYEDNGQNIYFVKDNGVGFDMQYYDKLFGVFQRLHADSEFEGTGIGLSIAHRIVNRHGGRIWAEGKVGEGATFYFAIPNSYKRE